MSERRCVPRRHDACMRRRRGRLHRLAAQPVATGLARWPALLRCWPRRRTAIAAQQRRADRREADRRGGQHLDQPDAEGAGGRAAAAKLPEGRAASRSSSRTSSTARAASRRPTARCYSLGSGFVIDGKEGIIVTNNHVIDGADEIIVNFNDGTKLKVEKVLGKDTKTDLALLKVTPKKPLPAVPFGASSKMQVGDWVMADRQPVRPRRLGDASASSRPSSATSTPGPTTTTCRPTPPSTRATPAGRCSTWTARSSA